MKVGLLLLLALPSPCLAQWMTQQIQLVPGWNAVFLHVQPEPRSCDKIFEKLPVESVWKWDRRFTTVQFSTDPATLLPQDPDWLVWLPPSDSRAFLNRLFELQGSQAYLIKVASNAAAFTLPIKGRVIIPRLEWFPHGLNLVGLPVNPRNPPTFSKFFEFTPEVSTSQGYGNQLFRLDSAGHGQQIVQPARDRIQPGAAYWVGCARTVAHMAAIHAGPQGGAVDFGELLTQQELSIRNPHPTAAVTARVSLRTSESAPLTGGFPEVAGPVPLSVLISYPNYEYTTNYDGNTGQRSITTNVLAGTQWEWVDFPANGLSRTLSPQEEWVIKLGVRRQDFVPYQAQGTNGAAYQSVLEITDSTESLLIWVPARASRTSTLQSTLGSASDAHSSNEGLWVGQVTVNRVDAPAYTTDLLPAPAPASFRLLMHVDGYGQASLLQQVWLAWDSGLTNAPYTNGTYALYASQAGVPAGATDVNRISSVGFPPIPPLPLTSGTTNTDPFLGVLTGTVTVGANDPVNPFLHRYHPMHDNKNWQFQTYADPIETRSVERSLTFRFNSATNTSADSFWGVDAVSGTYQEALSGLRAQTIHVQGVFTLQRISRINSLIVP